jgi:hypothetical protein
MSGMMLPVSLEWPSVKAWFMVSRSMARLAASRHPLVMPCGLAADWLEGEPLGARQLLGEFAADQVDNVYLAALECDEPRRLVGDHPEYQALDARRLAPVLVEGLQGEICRSCAASTSCRRGGKFHRRY